MSTADVAVLGCGYVGLALGEVLVESGHDVVGVRRSDEGLDAVREAGLRPVRADVTDPGSLAAVPDADAVVFTASTGGRGPAAAREVYVRGLEATIDAFADRERPPERLLYTSSTGVYGDHGGEWVDEDSALRAGSEKSRVLVDAESTAASAADAGIEPTVARLGGVYGPDRYRIERYLEGPVVEGYLSLIHRDDAGGALAHLLAMGTDAPRTVNVVDDEPVWKPDLAAWLAEQCGVEPPETRTLEAVLADDDRSDASKRRLRGQKRVSNDRLRSLGYAFDHPSYRSGYRAAIERFRGG